MKIDWSWFDITVQEAGFTFTGTLGGNLKFTWSKEAKVDIPWLTGTIADYRGPVCILYICSESFK